MTLTADDFRQAMGCFATGVTVITVDHEGEVHGMTANAFCSVSLDPMLVLVCVDHRARTHAHLHARKRFGINVLRNDQQAISEYYARAFENPPAPETSGVHLITATDGLWSPATNVTPKDLERFATVPIDANEPRYRLPLERDAERLAGSLGEECDVVLLGSIATRKYVDVLEPIFGDRLLFPMEFIGHGDMARGAMLLKRAASGVELTYSPVSNPLRVRPRRKTERGAGGDSR